MKAADASAATETNLLYFMRKFEYRLLDTVGGFFSGIDYQELTTHLNQLGREGWEVVSTVGVPQREIQE